MTRISRRKFVQTAVVAGAGASLAMKWPRAFANAGEPVFLQEFGYGNVTLNSPPHEKQLEETQDLLRGRHLEVEETYGYAVARAVELGLPVPALETCYRLLAAIDRSVGS